MEKVYTTREAYEQAKEEEFRRKCWEASSIYGSVERTTLDGEWTEEELKETMLDEIAKILHGDKTNKGWLEINKHRAVKNKDFLHEEFICTNICDRFDLIEVYNRVVDLHRNDKPRLFGIHYFDQIVHKEVNKMLKENLISGS